MVRLITDYLDSTVLKYPEKVAFADGKDSITFKELQVGALSVAAILKIHKCTKKPVAIFLDKGISCLVGMLGVAYSGCYYTVIDTAMPEERISRILDIFQPEYILTDFKHQDQAAQIFPMNQILIFDRASKNLNDTDISEIRSNLHKVIDTDVLYVLFTSGSTGIPKGVVISHKSVIAFTEWVHQQFKTSELTTIGNQTPFYFSMSVLDIFQVLKCGCTMYIIPRILFSFPIKLLEFIAEKSITMIYWVPSALSVVANLKALGKRDISCLNTILFSGEVMPVRQLNQWRQAVPNALYANLFGPTEVTDVCGFYIVDRDLSDRETVPIGKARLNNDIILLNDKNKQSAEGEQGEIFVRGSNLAYGYYGNPEKTAQAFVQNPLNTNYPEIIYRTGDLAHYNDRGELIYDGRKDFQIKHMGHRIELGEIETTVSSIPEVMQNCALYDTEKKKIVLFYTGSISQDIIVDRVKELLLHYMVPNRVVHLKRMPLNMNGKIDRVALKQML